ncbi:acylneuraminate cytidylyltransferase family protein [Nesterenkonia haasae]|uniref:acylneuraminate cytidylyltransferase family protein n=1 Tax=Nesterenkonia haasae TaxID=2587813 RepID=UPI001391CF4D|nr:acylneuraminate cytidylyltransferase family protein [Nesterenkonia haasae]NDK33175.1 acylneuraminate cytidylyltransferase family protein [Nesterenkonia haasae]
MPDHTGHREADSAAVQTHSKSQIHEIPRSDTDSITVVIPARAGSERVKHKNTRPFASYAGGLLELKLQQLTRTSEIDKIIVSSNDPAVLDYTAGFAQNHRDERIVALERPDELGRSSTPMSVFIDYVAQLQETGTMCMTHVTHPLIGSEHFAELISAWRSAAANGHDSLLTVTKRQTFLWDENGPYNYDPTEEKWPRSQDITPLYEINHGAYLIPFRVMREAGDRVGHNPQMYELPESVVLDIDWEDQFTLLEDIVRAKELRGISIL